MSDDTGRCTGMGAMLATGVAGAAETGVVAPDAGTEDDDDPCGAACAADGGASCRTGTFAGVRAAGVGLRGAVDELGLEGAVYEYGVP